MSKVTFVTYAELAKDCTHFCERLRGHFVGIVGVPRDGMLPAHLLGLQLNLPTVPLAEFCRSGLATGRSDGSHCRIEVPSGGRVLVVDESIGQGVAYRKTKEILATVDQRWECTFAVMYGTSAWQNRSDICVHRIIDGPRYFAWNWCGHPNLPNIGFDMDGVLCRDPSTHEDGSHAHAAELAMLPPRHIPEIPIGAVITARLRTRRDVTETWLRQQRVTPRLGLHMAEFDTDQDRGRYGGQRRKGEVYRDLPLDLFVESHDRYAEEIAKVSGKPVISLQGGLVFQ